MTKQAKSKWSALVLTLAFAGAWMASRASMAASPATEQPAASSSAAANAMDSAAKSSKYLFIFFFSAEDANTTTMRGVFKSAMTKMADRADSIAVNVADPAEKAIVEKFKVRGAPMPLVLAVAPIGAPTRAFPKTFNEAQLKEAFVSPCWAKCIKAIFERRSVLLCVQNEKTQSGQEALQGAETFKADPQYTKGTEIVVLDPADQAEQAFLKALQVDPKTPSAVTVLITPPGAPAARFAGAVTKEQIEAAVKAAQTSCGPGCSCHH